MLWSNFADSLAEKEEYLTIPIPNELTLIWMRACTIDLILKKRRQKKTKSICSFKHKKLEKKRACIIKEWEKKNAGG